MSYNSHDLLESINRFAYTLAEGDVEISYVSQTFFIFVCNVLAQIFSIKRIVHPPRTLENVGFFLPDGEVELDDEDFGLESAEVDDNDNGSQEQADEDVRKSCPMYVLFLLHRLHCRYQYKQVMNYG